jgi:hypothetical protein
MVSIRSREAEAWGARHFIEMGKANPPHSTAPLPLVPGLFSFLLLYSLLLTDISTLLHCPIVFANQ